MVMAVLVSLERKIAFDLKHAFGLFVADGEEKKYLSILYSLGSEVLEETLPLPSGVHTKGMLHFLADFKNTDKVIIYEDLIDGFKQTKVDEAISTIRKLKAENENLKRTICDLMGEIHSLRERLEERCDDEDDEIIPVAVDDDD